MTEWKDFVKGEVFSARRPATPRVDVKLLYGEDESRRCPDCWGRFVEEHISRVSRASSLVLPEEPHGRRDQRRQTRHAGDSNVNVITR